MSSSIGFVTVGAESIDVVACCDVVKGWLVDATVAKRVGSTIPCSRATCRKYWFPATSASSRAHFVFYNCFS
jgi:hypothetical protein